LKSNIPFEVNQALETLGSNIHRARVRRRMTKEELAAACQVSRKTLYSLEKGDPGVSLGVTFSALWALGLLDSTNAIADPNQDEHGKILEAARQPKRVRHSKAVDNDF